MERSKLDKLGRTVVPSKIRNFLGIKTGDTIEWIIRGNDVIIRKSISGTENIKKRLDKLRKKAPKCFTSQEEIEESDLSRGLEKWSLAKLGLTE